MKTQQEIDGLKHAWLCDPCWDIETSEGFEDHKDELLQYRIKQEEIWEMKHNKRLQAKAEKLGVPGNVQLAQYIEILETRILSLEENGKN